MARALQPLVGDCVRTGAINRDDAVLLVKTMFNGRRSLPIGTTGHSVIIKGFDDLTKHLQECLITIILTSPAVVPEGAISVGIDELAEAEA